MKTAAQGIFAKMEHVLVQYLAMNAVAVLGILASTVKMVSTLYSCPFGNALCRSSLLSIMLYWKLSGKENSNNAIHLDR